MIAEGTLKPKRWTADEVARLIELGAIRHPERYVLLNGEIKEKMGQNNPHVGGVYAIGEALRAVFGDDYAVASQAPIKGDSLSEPEPDAAVYRLPGREFIRLGARWQDLALVVEVADSSLYEDRGEMAEIYSRLGAPEYWILNLRNRTLEIRREPKEGEWASLTTLGEDEFASPLEIPESRIHVYSLMPPRQVGE